MAQQPSNLFLLALLIFITFQNGYATNEKTTGFSFKLIHRHSRESPMYRANLTKEDRLREYVEMSSSRVTFLARLYGAKNNTRSLKYNHTNDDEVVRPSIGYSYSMYYVVVGIGTFNLGSRFRNYYLNFDTGSDLTWTQCEGCAPNCFRQLYPPFPASKSLSYHKFICENCPSSGICLNDICTIKRQYADGSVVVVLPSLETFTLQSEPNSVIKLFNVFFGCGVDMRNFVEGNRDDNIVSGILGMGYGDYSFVFQSYKMTKGIFSYCLQSPTVIEEPVGHNAPMYLRFGSDTLQQPKMQITPMKQVSDRSLYYLDLQGISIADERLFVDPSIYKLKQNGNGGCIIDTGSAFSFVVSEAFMLMLNVVTKKIQQHNPSARRMIPPPPEIPAEIELCYQGLVGTFVNLPTITFHFANDADLIIQPSSVFDYRKLRSGISVLCLMFLESTEAQHNSVTLLGAYQQANHRIIYDTDGNRLIFGEADCSTVN